MSIKAFYVLFCSFACFSYEFSVFVSCETKTSKVVFRTLLLKVSRNVKRAINHVIPNSGRLFCVSQELFRNFLVRTLKHSKWHVSKHSRSRHYSEWRQAFTDVTSDGSDKQTAAIIQSPTILWGKQWLTSGNQANKLAGMLANHWWRLRHTLNYNKCCNVKEF